MRAAAHTFVRRTPRARGVTLTLEIQTASAPVKCPPRILRQPPRLYAARPAELSQLQALASVSVA